MKNVAYIQIPIKKINLGFFKLWIEFLYPLHKLRDKLKLVLAEILRTRYEIIRDNPDKDLDFINNTLFDKEHKCLMAERLGIPYLAIMVHISELRKLNIINKNQVLEKLIPKYNKTDKSFTIVVNFALDE